MPLYEYKCPNGHLTEVIHGMNDPSPERCEVCGAGPLVRVLHPVAVHYKGSGFYTTDYGRKSKQPPRESGGGDSSGGSGGSGSGDSSSSSSGSGESSSSSGDGKKAAEA
jgi:putative FmdB family regulatory protein